MISLGSNDNLVEGNTMYRNGDAGVYIQDSARNQVIDNIAHQESDGGVVLNDADDTVIRGNDLRFNPNGVETADSNDLVIEDNDGSDSHAGRLRDRQRREHPDPRTTSPTDRRHRHLVGGRRLRRPRHPDRDGG